MARISGSVAASSISAVEIGEFGGDAAIGLHAIGHRTELGEFARELDVGFGRQSLRQLGFDRRVAREQGVELGFREHGLTSCRVGSAVYR